MFVGAPAAFYSRMAGVYHYAVAFPLLGCIGTVLKAQQAPKEEKGDLMFAHKSLGLLTVRSLSLLSLGLGLTLLPFRFGFVPMMVARGYFPFVLILFRFLLSPSSSSSIQLTVHARPSIHSFNH